MTWSSWSDVVDRAQLFFQAGAPFSTLTHLQRDRLTDGIRIRNRIAHSSTKVRNDFNEVARRHLGLAPDKKLSQGYDVGQLLLDKSTKCFAKGLKQATYFEHYAHLFYEMAATSAQLQQKQTAPNHAICAIKTNPPNERSILTIRELPRDAVWEDSREAAPDSRVEGMLAIRHPEASLDQSLLSDRLAAETNAQTHK